MNSAKLTIRLRTLATRAGLCCLGTTLALAGSPPAQAVDTEVFFNDVVAGAPNILFVIDTSGTMWKADDTTADPFNPLVDYAALIAATYPDQTTCTSDAIYWSQGGARPDCSGTDYVGIQSARFECDVPSVESADRTVTEILTQVGKATYNGKIAQRDPTKTRVQDWKPIDQRNWNTLCEGDTSTGPAFNNPPTNWGGNLLESLTFWTGERANYALWNALEAGGDTASEGPRIEVVKQVVDQLLDGISGVNVGLMRYSAQNVQNWEGTASECVPSPEFDSQTGEIVEGQGQAGGGMILAPTGSVDDVDHESLLRSMLRAGSALYDDQVYDSAVSKYPRGWAQGANSACDLPVFTPNGRTPISETLLEAYKYYRNEEWDFGSRSNVASQQPFLSVPESLEPGSLLNDPKTKYKSPITDACAANYIILLSDGTTAQDSRDTEIESLDNGGTPTQADDFKNVVGTNCDEEPSLKALPSAASDCVNDIAKYMNRIDLAPQLCTSAEAANGDCTAGQEKYPGVQNVTTYTVGFKLESLTDPLEKTAAVEVLEKTARDGGASCVKDTLDPTKCKQPIQFMRTANDRDELIQALQGIVEDILKGSFTFTAPAVAVNAFNRLENLEDLYYAVFEPGNTYRWRGNLKKYRLGVGGTIKDADGLDAIEPAKASFRDDARSFWSVPGDDDGNDVTAGGAAAKLPDSAPRKLLTDNGSSFVSLSTITDSVALGIQPGDALLSSPVPPAAPLPLTADALVDWIAGQDIDDFDGDGNTTEMRGGELGDPLHGRPALVIYDGTPTDPIQKSAIFLMTNDGMLHAFDPTDDGSRPGKPGGTEYWAFMPSALLSRVKDLYYDELRGYDNRIYGLDGSIRVSKTDLNKNGIVDGDDQVYLFFGMRRGGTAYYGINVTDRENPELMWIADSLPGVAQTWSTPSPMTQVRIGTEDIPVIFVSGGFTELHEGQPFVPADASGNCIYMLNALTGKLLWRACGPGAGDSGGEGGLLYLPLMKNAVAADVRALDLTADGFADRLYAADLGGRIWRFDIQNGNVAGELVEGGLFATLGTGDVSPVSNSAARRHFYATDIAPVRSDGQFWLNISIGSGHREQPKSDIITSDGFYSLRDYNVYSTIESSNYYLTSGSCTDVVEPCHEVIRLADLQDVSSTVNPAIVAQPGRAVPAGWRIMFTEAGEKVLAESVTFQGNVFFTTYTPRKDISAQACSEVFGVNKLYAVSIINARPPQDLNRDGIVNQLEDRSVELRQQGIAAPPTIIFPPRYLSDPDDGFGGEPCGPGERPGIGITGTETFFPGCIGKPIRTFWRQRGVPEGEE